MIRDEDQGIDKEEQDVLLNRRPSLQPTSRSSILRKRLCRFVLMVVMIVSAFLAGIKLGNDTSPPLVLRRHHQPLMVDLSDEAESMEIITPRQRNDPIQHASSKLKIALLISFPNSGTTYTLSTVKRASERAVATNYCEDAAVIPVFHHGRASPQIMEPRQYPLPQNYILTKTHCAGYCNYLCKPHDYATVTTEHFRFNCFRSCTQQQNKTEGDNHETLDVVAKQKHNYPESEVGKMVHLFRDPFDNLISRFHKHLKGATWKHPEDQGKYIRSPEGFQQYCNDEDARYRHKEKYYYYGQKLWNLARHLPCHAEFYRYVMWHNHAFEMASQLRVEHNVSTYILHYVDYYESFNTTMESLLEFLELPFVGTPKEFYWNNYSSYFTGEQRVAAQAFIKELASEDTWRQMVRYGFQ